RDLYDVLEAATEYHEQQLAGPHGRGVRGYLIERGVSTELQQRFRLGYAPADRHALKDHLVAQGISVDHQVRAGLLSTGTDIAVPYDRFRDRLMFPITDVKDRV